MRVNVLRPDAFRELVYGHAEELLERLAAPEAFIVRGFYAGDEILELRRSVFSHGLASEPSWHPLRDGCPDYHRLHDDYPQAHVKSRMHAFYHHGYRAENEPLFRRFAEIFAIKNHLGGFASGAFVDDLPSAGPVARVNFHHYPRGGGYIAEHVDPEQPFARIQTLVQASRQGRDFERGGLFARDRPGGEQVFVDRHTAPGDLVVLSPAIPHGVEPIDPEEPYEWDRESGKWTIIPIIVAADYAELKAPKPQPL